jgi:hypothetical protein
MYKIKCGNTVTPLTQTGLNSSHTIKPVQNNPFNTPIFETLFKALQRQLKDFVPLAHNAGKAHNAIKIQIAFRDVAAGAWIRNTNPQFLKKSLGIKAKSFDPKFLLDQKLPDLHGLIPIDPEHSKARGKMALLKAQQNIKSAGEHGYKHGEVMHGNEKISVQVLCSNDGHPIVADWDMVSLAIWLPPGNRCKGNTDLLNIPPPHQSYGIAPLFLINAFDKINKEPSNNAFPILHSVESLWCGNDIKNDTITIIGNNFNSNDSYNC